MKSFTVREYGAPFLDVLVYGVPKPQGSKRSWAYVPKDVMDAAVAARDPRMVRPKAALAEDNPVSVTTWRETVRATVLMALPRPWVPVDGPVRVDLVFCMPKPGSAPVRRRTWPHRKPDLDKLTRAVFDSLKDAGAWQDDARCVELHALKDFPGERMDRPGVWIRMWELPEEVTVPGDPAPTAARFPLPGEVPLPGMEGLTR
jgi:Holliday junction resolvase RusA-like endonuclease